VGSRRTFVVELQPWLHMTCYMEQCFDDRRTYDIPAWRARRGLIQTRRPIALEIPISGRAFLAYLLPSQSHQWTFTAPILLLDPPTRSAFGNRALFHKLDPARLNRRDSSPNAFCGAACNPPSCHPAVAHRLQLTAPPDGKVVVELELTD
jgi:hypothetical protein